MLVDAGLIGVHLSQSFLWWLGLVLKECAQALMAPLDMILVWCDILPLAPSASSTLQKPSLRASDCCVAWCFGMTPRLIFGHEDELFALQMLQHLGCSNTHVHQATAPNKAADQDACHFVPWNP